MFSKEQTEKALRLSVLDIFHPAHALVQYVPIINSKPATAPDRVIFSLGGNILMKKPIMDVPPNTTALL
jgi:hypothetical protein